MIYVNSAVDRAPGRPRAVEAHRRPRQHIRLVRVRRSQQILFSPAQLVERCTFLIFVGGDFSSDGTVGAHNAGRVRYTRRPPAREVSTRWDCPRSRSGLPSLLVPGLRARMRWVRFTTAMAVAAAAVEPLADEPPSDGVSTPAICFEWLLIEALVRRIECALPSDIPGSQKARTAINRGERLSPQTYLNSPRVFGFHGVYKPFGVESAC